MELPLLGMDSFEGTCASLRAQIAATETQLAGLKRALQDAEQAAAEAKTQRASHEETKRRWPLLDEEYRRYGRQMIVPQMGLQGAWLLLWRVHTVCY